MTASTESTAVPAAGSRVPDFFIVGHEKCGTTALYRLLAQHPEIFMPTLKETRFFVSERPAPEDCGEQGPRGAVRPQTLDQYLALFAPAGADRRAGEASPQYLRVAEAAQRIARIQPEARIVAILREPVAFLRSFHLNNVRDLIEDERDLCAALALEEQRREGRGMPREARAPGRLLYGEIVRYTEQLRRYEECFGRARMLVIVYEDFQRDNGAVLRRVLRFLGVDDTLALQTEHVKRERKAVRMKRLHRVAKALQLARRKPQEAGTFWSAVDRLTPGLLRSQRLEGLARRAVFSVPEPLDEELTLQLRRRFKPEVAALGEYLGRDMLAEWGYDRID